MNKHHKILHLGSHLGIYYHFLHDWIYADWTGEQTKESVQQGCELILQFMKAENCSKVLNDNSHVTSNWLEAAEWVALDWFPRMDAAGLKYFAWVYSPHTFSRLAADEALSFNSSTSNIIPFDDLNTAKAWLKSV